MRKTKKSGNESREEKIEKASWIFCYPLDVDETLEDKAEFFRSKGMTDADILEAFDRSFCGSPSRKGLVKFVLGLDKKVRLEAQVK